MTDYTEMLKHVYKSDLDHIIKKEFLYSCPQDYQDTFAIIQTLLIMITTNALEQLDIDLINNAEEWANLISKSKALFVSKGLITE